MKTEGGITILGTVLLDSREMPVLGEFALSLKEQIWSKRIPIEENKSSSGVEQTF